MQKTTKQSHSKETFLYITSRALERASYYGIRAIITLYMVNGLHLPEIDAFYIYSVFLTALIFSQILGAVVGDLIIGNKKAMIIGGVLQALGAFALCIPSVNGLYIGMSLILLGSGLYGPNIMSQFGKLYLNKQRIMDSGFSMYYTAINLGAFIGTFIIISLESVSYTIGFITGAAFMLLSVIFSLFVKEKKEIIETTSNKINSNKRLLTLLVAVLIVAVYWAVYEYSSNGFYYIDSLFAKNPKLGIGNIFSTFSSSFILPIGIVASIIWTFMYTSQLAKITIGFISGAIALAVLLFLPEIMVSSSVLIFMLSMFFLNLAEMHIGPILYSILTKNSNPKYLAIIISLSFIPSKIFIYVMELLLGKSDTGMFSIVIGAIILSVIAIALVILLIVKKENFPMISSSEGTSV